MFEEISPDTAVAPDVIEFVDEEAGTCEIRWADGQRRFRIIRCAHRRRYADGCCTLCGERE